MYSKLYATVSTESRREAMQKIEDLRYSDIEVYGEEVYDYRHEHLIDKESWKILGEEEIENEE